MTFSFISRVSSSFFSSSALMFIIAQLQSHMRPDTLSERGVAAVSFSSEITLSTLPWSSICLICRKMFLFLQCEMNTRGTLTSILAASGGGVATDTGGLDALKRPVKPPHLDRKSVV